MFTRSAGILLPQEGGVVPPSDSLGYIAESERFITDIAAVAKNERDAEFTKREQMHYNKRCAGVICVRACVGAVTKGQDRALEVRVRCAACFGWARVAGAAPRLWLL
jgi:hypothetical protein